jgi:hypothetical protein
VGRVGLEESCLGYLEGERGPVLRTHMLMCSLYFGGRLLF